MAEFVRGLDLSSYQLPIDPARVAKAGVGFVYLKATEGRSTAGGIARFAQAFRALGVEVGCYHFVDKKLRNSSHDEADAFRSVYSAVREYCTLPPALDVEPEGTGDEWGSRGFTRRELAAWCRAWAIRVGHPCIALYYPLRRSFVPALLAAFPGAFRWPASRPVAWRKNNIDTPPADAWRAMPRDADLWQFASRGTSVDGCTGSVDLDIARADRFAQMLRVGA